MSQDCRFVVYQTDDFIRLGVERCVWYVCTFTCRFKGLPHVPKMCTRCFI